MVISGNRKLVGVMVRYCNGNEKEDEWINLDEVGGLVWWDKNDDFDRSSAKHDPADRPHQTSEPSCPVKGPYRTLSTLSASEAGGGVCWWNGTEWICCD